MSCDGNVVIFLTFKGSLIPGCVYHKILSGQKITIDFCPARPLYDHPSRLLKVSR